MKIFITLFIHFDRLMSNYFVKEYFQNYFKQGFNFRSRNFCAFSVHLVHPSRALLWFIHKIYLLDPSQIFYCFMHAQNSDEKLSESCKCQLLASKFFNIFSSLIFFLLSQNEIVSLYLKISNIFFCEWNFCQKQFTWWWWWKDCAITH